MHWFVVLTCSCLVVSSSADFGGQNVADLWRPSFEDGGLQGFGDGPVSFGAGANLGGGQNCVNHNDYGGIGFGGGDIGAFGDNNFGPAHYGDIQQGSFGGSVGIDPSFGLNNFNGQQFDSQNYGGSNGANSYGNTQNPASQQSSSQPAGGDSGPHYPGLVRSVPLSYALGRTNLRNAWSGSQFSDTFSHYSNSVQGHNVNGPGIPQTFQGNQQNYGGNQQNYGASPGANYNPGKTQNFEAQKPATENKNASGRLKVRDSQVQGDHSFGDGNTYGAGFESHGGISEFGSSDSFGEQSDGFDNVEHGDFGDSQISHELSSGDRENEYKGHEEIFGGGQYSESEVQLDDNKEYQLNDYSGGLQDGHDFQFGDLDVSDQQKEGDDHFEQEHHVKTKVITKVEHVPVPYKIEKITHYPVKKYVDRPVPKTIEKPYPVKVVKEVKYPVTVKVPKPYPVVKEIKVPVKVTVDRPVPYKVYKKYPVYKEKIVHYPVVKKVHYPVKEFYEVKKPYYVYDEVIKKVPVHIEKKVPVKVPYEVKKPYPVYVKKPYPVVVEKKVPYVVEKKVPYEVKVPKYVKVKVPVFEHKEEHKEHDFDEHSYD